MQTGLLSTYKKSVSSRGIAAWVASLILFAFYVIIYFTGLLDPVATALGLGSRWTIYGILYTLAVTTGGLFFLKRHGNSRGSIKRFYSE